MSPHDPLAYLQMLLSKDFESHRYARDKTKPGDRKPLVITISRDYGALGEQIAQELGKCLQIPVYDKEILGRVAKHTKADKALLEQYDEQSQAGGISAILYSLISGTTATVQSYRRALFDVVLDIAHHDCIIVGRGAHLILKEKAAFRLRIVGSKPVCGARVAQEEGLSQSAAEDKVFEINDKRHKAVNTLYEEHFPSSTLEHAVNFDLVINTDRLDAQAATLVTILALEQSGVALHRGDKA